MEFTVKKFDLLRELNLTQGVVERKTTIPILSHLLCEAKGNRVTLTATDLELRRSGVPAGQADRQLPGADSTDFGSRPTLPTSVHIIRESHKAVPGGCDDGRLENLGRS